MNPEIGEPQAAPGRVGPAALGLLLAAVVAAVTAVHFSGGLFCSVERSQGAQIDQALGLVFVGGLVGSVLLLPARKRPRLLQLSRATDPRLAQFVDHFAGGGQGGEPSGYCTGGTGSPVG